jgi:predicted transcriptional regulator
MKSYSVARRQIWIDEDDDEVTSEIVTLGALAKPATVVTPGAAVNVAREMLAELRIPAIAVVEDDVLCGVITRTDVLRAVPKNENVASIMSRCVFVLPAEAPIERAAALMAFEGVACIVVIGDGGSVVGVVSALDIAHYLAVREGYLAE